MKFHSPHKLILLAQDILLISVTYYVLSFLFLRTELFITIGINYILVLSIIIILFKFNHLYKYQFLLNFSKQFLSLLGSLIISMLTFVFFLFVFKETEILYNRIYIIALFCTIFILMLVFRGLIVPSVFDYLIRRKIIKRDLIIIGAGEYGKKISEAISIAKRRYFDVIGFLDDDASKVGKNINNLKVFGIINDLPEIIKLKNIRHILIAIENVDDERLNEIVEIAIKTNTHVYVISKHFRVVSEKMPVEEFSNLSAFKLNPVRKSNHAYLIIKRFLDLFISILVLFLFSPLWVIITLIIKLTSSGPVLYKNNVIGKNGKVFTWYKFRSMYHNNDHSTHETHLKEIIKNGKPGKKLQNDYRITPFGNFLRKYSLDEFPQLICVLKGDMSLVGPRPSSQHEYSLMNEWQRGRFSVIPGLTCLWQVYGRNEVKFNEQIALDKYYIEHQSFFFDLEILLKTIPVVLFGIRGN